MAELMRLQKYIALCGIASRRRAEELITSGCVFVNQICVDTLGSKIDPSKDRITVNGKPAVMQAEFVYLMLHKPRGYVSTVKDNFNRKTVLELVPTTFGRIYPVGRLDYDSEGLLLLTNDGDFTYRLTHPGHEVTKTYIVSVDGVPSAAALDCLRHGVVIDGVKTSPASVKLLHTSEKGATLTIVIHEGRNRQVRKMCAAIGFKVTRLCRVAEGALRLGDLPCGSWRHLTKEEVSLLGGTDHVHHTKNRKSK